MGNRKGYYKEYGKRRREQLRTKILNIISNNNPHCVRCGCDDIRFLEINHKNGGGTKEKKEYKTAIVFYRNILRGIRKVDDLEILCRICNAHHYLESRFGELPYKIYYNKGKGEKK